MRLSAVGYQNRVSYTSNNDISNSAKVVEPKKNDNIKKVVKYAGLAILAAGAVALLATKGKSLVNTFKKSAGAPNTNSNLSEKIEEIVPEVLDFDTVWGPKIAARKMAKKKH